MMKNNENDNDSITYINNISELKMTNKKIIYNLKEFGKLNYTAEYFDIIKFNGKYHLYFTCFHTLNVVISNTLDFTNKNAIKTIDCPQSTFSLLVEGKYLYLLCGGQLTISSPKEIKIPVYHIPGTKYSSVLDHKKKRTDRKNGVYLLRSTNGIDWESIKESPVMHLFVESNTCRLGECAYDTKPVLIKHNNEYIYYGRLNSDSNERHVYYRKSKNLIDWGPPNKINIINEKTTTIDGNKYNKNYYNLAVFKVNKILYAFCPYFDIYKKFLLKQANCKTILMKSENGVDWEIINSYLPKKERYEHRVSCVVIDNNMVNVFFREKILETNQNLVSYEFIKK